MSKNVWNKLHAKDGIQFQPRKSITFHKLQPSGYQGRCKVCGGRTRRVCFQCDPIPLHDGPCAVKFHNPTIDIVEI